MPKAILEFNLPEEQSEFDCARKGTQLQCAIDDVFQFIRKKLKYEELPDATIEVLEALRDELNSSLCE